MKKTTKTILKYIIELVIVAFGVFLGVYFSNINTENKTKAEKKKSLELIVREMENNQELLKKYIEYHEILKIQIDSIAPTLSKEVNFSTVLDKQFDFKTIDKWNGFQYARLQKTAFDGAKISGILQEFDIELIQKISGSYELQQTYMDFGNLILRKALDTNASTKVVDFMGLITLLTTDMLNIEKGLNTEFEKTKQELKSLPTDH